MYNFYYKYIKKIKPLLNLLFFYTNGWIFGNFILDLFLKRTAAIKFFNFIALHMWKKSTNVNFVSQFILDTHHHKFVYIYFNVRKNNIIIFKKILLYIFRFISYLFILNLLNL